MGGNKSKPIVESARNVISRRKPSDHVPASPRGGASQDAGGNEINSNIVNEMAKWSVIKSTPEKVFKIITVI